MPIYKRRTSVKLLFLFLLLLPNLVYSAELTITGPLKTVVFSSSDLLKHPSLKVMKNKKVPAYKNMDITFKTVAA